MRRMMLAASVGLGGLLMLTPIAESRSAQQAGYARAKRQGMAEVQARCFASVFGNHARQTPRGGWAAPRWRGTGGYGYRLELQNRCGLPA
jgi:hypothetical protein